jgi:hypothetical protein
MRHNEWFPVDREDDEMVVLAEPVFKCLDEQGLSYKGPHRGCRQNGSFEIELSFCTKEDAGAAQRYWLFNRYNGWA